MIVNVLRVLLRAEHFVILQRLPAIFPVVVRRVENDAVRMQMRIECARSLVLKQRRYNLSSPTI